MSIDHLVPEATSLIPFDKTFDLKNKEKIVAYNVVKYFVIFQILIRFEAKKYEIRSKF